MTGQQPYPVPEGYYRTVTSVEVGVLCRRWTRRAAEAEARDANWGGPCEYRAVRRGLRWAVVAFQAKLVAQKPTLVVIDEVHHWPSAGA